LAVIGVEGDGEGGVRFHLHSLAGETGDLTLAAEVDLEGPEDAVRVAGAAFLLENLDQFPGTDAGGDQQVFILV
jgi:hypothetical protein